MRATAPSAPHARPTSTCPPFRTRRHTVAAGESDIRAGWTGHRWTKLAPLHVRGPRTGLPSGLLDPLGGSSSIEQPIARRSTLPSRRHHAATAASGFSGTPLMQVKPHSGPKWWSLRAKDSSDYSCWTNGVRGHIVPRNSRALRSTAFEERNTRPVEKQSSRSVVLSRPSIGTGTP